MVYETTTTHTTSDLEAGGNIHINAGKVEAQGSQITAREQVDITATRLCLLAIESTNTQDYLDRG